MEKIKKFLAEREKVSAFDEKPKYWLALYVPVYLILFFTVEHLVTENYYVSWIPLDDKIPFCEYFVVFYSMWYPLLFAAGFYLMFTDGKRFNRYMYFLAVGFTASLVFCLIFPNGQDLRPDPMPRQNFFTWLLGRIYAADTNTNVIPSMHVIGCFAASAGLLSSPNAKRWIGWGSVALGLIICASTVLVKQHSILDVFIAIIVCVPLYLIIFRPFAERKRKYGTSRRM